MSRRVPICCVVACTVVAGLAFGLRQAKEQGASTAFLERPVMARGVNGSKIDLRSPDRGASVVFFHTPEDAETLRRAEALRQAHPASRVQVVCVCVGAFDPAGSSPLLSIVDDRHAKLARQFGVGATPEAFVLVEDGRLCYRGSMNGIGEALASALSGRTPAITSKKVIGTRLSLPSSESASSPTFTVDVEPILRRSCRSCHQPGRSAPFSLITHAQAAKRAGDLADVAERRLMPP
jgi:hypothetical protein